MEEKPVVMFMLSMHKELSYHFRGFTNRKETISFVTLYTD